MRRITPVLFLAVLSAAPALSQGFGGVVALDGETVYVSETRNGAWPGVVYLYQPDDGGSWMEAGRLQAPEGDGQADRFGMAMAAGAGHVVVGAPGRDENAGAVYLFTSMESPGRRLDENMPPGARLGAAVARAGGYVIAGAPGLDDDRGGAFVYHVDAAGEWTGSALPLPEELAGGDRFGAVVAADGGRLLVSAPGQAEGAGAVYAYHEDGGSWVLDGALPADGLGARDGFGSTLALAGGEAYVGAPGVQGTGVVYAYTLTDEGRWNAGGTLMPFDGGRGRFGSALALDGADVWVGAPRASGFRGAVYRFHRDEDGRWTSVRLITDDTLPRRAGYGSALAAGAGVAAVGVTGADFGAGVVRLLRRDGDDWADAGSVWNELRNYAAVRGEKVPCRDGHAGAFDCRDVDMVAFLPVQEMGGGRGVRTNDLWGWTDPETGREFALVGLSNGTSFVEVSDPGMPRYLGFLPMTEGARGSVWRDIKVYRDHAFIVSDGAGPHGVQIFDLRQLRDVEGDPVTFEETAHYDGVNSAHNIVINEATGFAYVVGSSMGGETCGGGLHMLDIREPEHPVFAGCFADPSTGRRGTGYSHDAQCVTYQGPDVEHQGREICFGANETALSIADVTDKEHPVALSRATYPKVAYTHQGWLTEDQRYFYMNDEGDEPRGLVEGTRTLVWDVQDLEDPQLIFEYIASTTSTDHNLYVKGNLMYQSNYDAGFRILDITNPERPVEVGYFDTVPYQGGGGSWSNYPYFKSGVVAVTSSREGLFLLKKKDVDL